MSRPNGVMVLPIKQNQWSFLKAGLEFSPKQYCILQNIFFLYTNHGLCLEIMYNKHLFFSLICLGNWFTFFNVDKICVYKICIQITTLHIWSYNGLQKNSYLKIEHEHCGILTKNLCFLWNTNVIFLYIIIIILYIIM